MIVEVEDMERLLLAGREVRGVNGAIEYRTPDGISGSTYQADDLSDFPSPVTEWLRQQRRLKYAERR